MLAWVILLQQQIEGRTMDGRPEVVNQHRAALEHGVGECEHKHSLIQVCITEVPVYYKHKQGSR
jgi:hypothetical protein